MESAALDTHTLSTVAGADRLRRAALPPTVEVAVAGERLPR